jgi:hypothetical protein
MKKTLAAGLALAAMMSIGCSDQELSVKAAAATPDVGDRVGRGEYLVKVIGCNDCHTPMKMGPNGPEHDMTRYLSGHPEQIGPMNAPTLEEPWQWAAAPTMTAFAGPVGHYLRRQPDAGPEHGAGHLDGGHVHQGPSDGPAHGDVTADSAADAVACVPKRDRRRPGIDLRLPAVAEADCEPRARRAARRTYLLRER